MKKKIIIIVISAVVLLGIGCSVYLLFFNTNVKNNNKTTTANTTTITTTTRSTTKENIIHTDTFTYKINNKDKEVKFVYIKESGDTYYESYGYSKQDIQNTKEANEYPYNIIYLKIFIDDIEVESAKIPIYYDTSTKNTKFTEFYKKSVINKFSGEDKEYFLFKIVAINNLHCDRTTIPIVVNENGKLLYKIKFLECSGVSVEDKTSRFYNLEQDGSSGGGQFIVAKDKVYFIKPMCRIPEKYFKNSDDYLIGENNELIQEYILTVDNDVVNIEQSGVYIGFGAGTVPECSQ